MLSTRSWLCAIAFAALGSAALAAPRVSLRAAPECGVAAAHCSVAAWSDRRGQDAAVVIVEGAGGKPLQAVYLSDYGPRNARLVTDDESNTFLLLEYGIGRGQAHMKYLAVFRVTDRLQLLRKVQLRYWLSPGSAAEYSYGVENTFGGGITIQLTRHFTGKAGTWSYPPPAQTISIPPAD